MAGREGFMKEQVSQKGQMWDKDFQIKTGVKG